MSHQLVSDEPRAATVALGDLLRVGPSVIGSTGGSGSRVVARIARRGDIFIGTNLNVQEDALYLAAFLDHWIPAYWPHRNDKLPDDVEAAMLAELRAVLDAHCSGLGSLPRLWGWKAPPTIFLLPFFNRHMPRLRVLHLVRDGRDLAFSRNQNQLRKYGDTVLTCSERALRRPERAIALWSRVNLEAADFGEECLGARYLRIKFEDLCREPVPTIGRIIDFFELRAHADELASEVVEPESLGRWRDEKPWLVARLEEVARPALVRFGYQEASTDM